MPGQVLHAIPAMCSHRDDISWHRQLMVDQVECRLGYACMVVGTGRQHVPLRAGVQVHSWSQCFGKAPDKVTSTTRCITTAESAARTKS